MALIQCPECGREVSDMAQNCPHCGAPIKMQDKKFCQHCGAPIDKECVVCPKCGKQVAELKNGFSGNNDRNIIINNNNTSSSSASANNIVNPYMGGSLISPKSRLAALLLCFFLGIFGVHRFYAGKIGTGILMFLLMFTGIGEIWLIVDFILILVGSFSDNNGLKIKNW